MDTLSLVQTYEESLIAWRRRAHQNPELSSQETQTVAWIERELDAMGLSWYDVENGGVLAFLGSEALGPTVLLRADIDALPVTEDPCNLKQEKACISATPGVMHACGHDAHLAMLLTVAQVFSAHPELVRGRLILMFERGEESTCNLRHILRDLEQSQVHIDTACATHVRWDLPAGKIFCPDGPALTGARRFDVTLRGASGHGSRPDLTNNPIDCFTAIYANLQAMRMKYVRPDTSLTWSVGRVEAGSRFNVVPEELRFDGTLRFFDDEAGEAFWQRMLRMIAATAELYDCRWEIAPEPGIAPTVNDPTCAALFRRAAREGLGDCLCEAEPWMASETFGFVASALPAVDFFTGIRNDALGSGANHHTPQFDVDESALASGAAAMIAYAIAFMEDPPDLTDSRASRPSMSEVLERYGLS